MNQKWYGRMAALAVFLTVAATQNRISASAFDNGLHELAAISSYETILENKIEEETKPLQQSLEQVNVTDKISEFPAKRLYEISDTDFQILSRIVEAEATDKDIKSKILVANVVLNRLESEEFPDSIEEVVFQRENGTVQFSPTADGRYYSVDVTDSSRESVERALTGEDYSQGALYFVERSIADPANVRWFDRALTRLFEYEGHAFYK